MDVAGFRLIGLTLEGAEQSSHMGSPGFRVGGRIVATIASQQHGYRNLMLSLERESLRNGQLARSHQESIHIVGSLAPFGDSPHNQ
jgi:hypothetical protein